MLSGITGYIASRIAMYLLREGYSVHGTLRDINDKKKTAHIEKLQSDFPGQLSLFEADLMKEGSFEKAMKGCDIVIHTASPFFIEKSKDPEKDLIEPALMGTRNVLQTVEKISEVKRVVLTSSVAALYGDAGEINTAPGRIFTEEHWNTTSTAKHQPYSYSKTLAEREAWEIYGQQKRWGLVTINPGFVLGPSLSSRVDSTSNATMIQLGDGSFKSGVPELTMGIVDVRDVAKAHIMAAVNNDAKGRHILVAESLSFLEMSGMLREKYADYPLPSRIVPKRLFYLFGPFMGFSWKYIRNNVGVEISFDNSKSLNALGISYRPVKETVTDHFEALINNGNLPAK
jgi:nucleoside-diphosphate-sugar epimerase